MYFHTYPCHRPHQNEYLNILILDRLQCCICILPFHQHSYMACIRHSKNYHHTLQYHETVRILSFTHPPINHSSLHPSNHQSVCSFEMVLVWLLYASRFCVAFRVLCGYITYPNYSKAFSIRPSDPMDNSGFFGISRRHLVQGKCGYIKHKELDTK